MICSHVKNKVAKVLPQLRLQIVFYASRFSTSKITIINLTFRWSLQLNSIAIQVFHDTFTQNDHWFVFWLIISDCVFCVSLPFGLLCFVFNFETDLILLLVKPSFFFFVQYVVIVPKTQFFIGFFSPLLTWCYHSLIFYN